MERPALIWSILLALQLPESHQLSTAIHVIPICWVPLLRLGRCLRPIVTTWVSLTSRQASCWHFLKVLTDRICENLLPVIAVVKRCILRSACDLVVYGCGLPYWLEHLFLNFFMNPVVHYVDMLCTIGNLIWSFNHVIAGGIIDMQSCAVMDIRYFLLYFQLFLFPITYI